MGRKLKSSEKGKCRGRNVEGKARREEKKENECFLMYLMIELSDFEIFWHRTDRQTDKQSQTENDENFTTFLRGGR